MSLPSSGGGASDVNISSKYLRGAQAHLSQAGRAISGQQSLLRFGARHTSITGTCTIHLDGSQLHML